MAFLGLFNYSKPGPGVDKGETNINRFFYFWELYFRKFWKLIELNILYILVCIPIVTIGPATAGLVYVLRNYADVRSTFLMHDFFQAFKKNFKQSIAIFFLDLLATGIVMFSFVFYWQNASYSKLMFIPLGGCVLAFILLSFMRYYTYLMAVTVDLKLKHIIKNAFIFSFVGLKTNFFTALFTVVIMVLLVVVPYLYLLFPILLGFSTIWFITVYNSYPYIVRYIVTPYEEKKGVSEQESEDAIFTDIGSAERAVAQTKTKSAKGRVIK